MAKSRLTRAMKLYGTSEKTTPLRELQAGAISVALDNGSLRYIRYHGVEVLRGISFLVRDRNWATYGTAISKLKVKKSKSGFTVTYNALCKDAQQEIEYSAHIEATGDTVAFRATAVPRSDFRTNRTGFVVLHPLEGVVGRTVEIGHVNGTREKARFPKIISPGQPAFEIRSLKHEVMPGVKATVVLEGNKFEMEDHRNWMDASYKTYVCSLLDPWPYTLPKGQAVQQSITLKLEGKPKQGVNRPRQPAISIAIGKPEGRMPQVGASIDRADAEAALQYSDLIKKLSLSRLVCQIDGRIRGQAETAAAFAELARRCVLPVKLEIILPAVNSPAEETSAIATAIRAGGLKPDCIVITQAHDLKSFQPNAPRPWGPSFEEMARAVRSQFPGIKVGGGTLSYFTELNRKPVPKGLFDFVTHTLCPIVHAADDISVMETLESLPWIVASTRKMIGKQAYHIGPSGISCRDNPYGATVSPNPDRGRVCLSGNDPRQQGLFAMAWNLGLAAAAAKGKVDEIDLGAVTGTQGVISESGIRPAFHALRGLGEAAGNKSVTIANNAPHKVATLMYETKEGRTLWIANLSGENQLIKLGGIENSAALTMLDEKNFATLVQEPDFLSGETETKRKISQIELGAYAAALVKIK